MPNTAATYPGTASDDASSGTIAWSNPNNIKVADSSFASATITSAGISHYLNAQNFGFAIPAGATINGIVVEINIANNRAFGRAFKDNVISLIKGGVVSGSNKSTGTSRPPSSGVMSIASFGGSTDLWGLSLSDTDINASNFGAVYQVAGNGGKGTNPIAEVDFIRITVYYTPAVVSVVPLKLLGARGGFY